MTGRRHRHKRGYPLAVLVGLDERRAVLWRVFSEVVKLDGTVEQRGEEDRRERYGFHESIVNVLRPALNEGIKSIVIAAPARTDHAVNFLNHIRKHHPWLVRESPNAASFGMLTGSASRPHQVHELVRTKDFREVIGETTSRDAKNIAAILEKSLGSDESGTVVSYSLDEIEDIIYSRQKRSGLRPEHLVLTDKYLEGAQRRGRILRLLQISKNIGIKTTIINAKTQAGLRLSQLGGPVCLDFRFVSPRNLRRSSLGHTHPRRVLPALAPR